MIPFRQNYWWHICTIEKKTVWKDIYYRSCDQCGYRNRKVQIRKGSKPI